MSEPIESLGDALPKEIERVMELIPQYEALGHAGQYALAMMRSDIRRAHKAMISGDVVEMVQVYESLKGFTS